jgi:hypothetical protein
VGQEVVQGLLRQGRIDARERAECVDHRRQVLDPEPARDANPVRPHLPGATYVPVQKRIGSPAMGGELGDRDDLLGLRRQQRQGYRLDTGHLLPGRVDVDGTGGVEVARAANLPEKRCEFLRNGGHL